MGVVARHTLMIASLWPGMHSSLRYHRVQAIFICFTSRYYVINKTPSLEKKRKEEKTRKDYIFRRQFNGILFWSKVLYRVAQRISLHPRSPSSTVDDCHRPLLEAIGHELMQRAQAGDETILLKVKSPDGIHGNEKADKLANEPADECCMGRHFDYDLSDDYTQPFQGQFLVATDHSGPGSRSASRNQSMHKRFGWLIEKSFAW